MHKEVLTEHAQWWLPELKGEIDTQIRKNAGATVSAGDGGPVLSAWCAEERSRVFRRELTECEERTSLDLAKEAKAKELEEWGHFKVSSPIKPGAQEKDLADTRRAPTWKEVDGAKTARARAAA